MFSCTANAYFYPKSYIASREQFKSLQPRILKIFSNARLGEVLISKDDDTSYTMDYFYIPQKESKINLLIITSGIHGAEAFTGAAIQIDFLASSLKQEWLDEMGFLVVHALNPYGYHQKTRVDQFNIDLNRNMSATAKDLNSTNKSYKKLERFLNPKGLLVISYWQDIKLFAKSIWYLLTIGRKEIAQAALGGQYYKPDGIYFGGNKRQTNSAKLQQLLLKYGNEYKNIFLIDLHTGYGERGKLHFFANSKTFEMNGLTNLFEGYDIDLGSDKDFYETTGGMDSLLIETFKQKELVIPMTFEFGTMDSQTTLGGFWSLRNIIFENQGRLHGYANQQSREKINKDFAEMFNPSSVTWRDQVVGDGVKNLEVLSERITKI